MLSNLRRILRRSYYRYSHNPAFRIHKSAAVTGNLKVCSPGGGIQIGRDCVVEGIMVVQAPKGQIVLQNNVYVGGDTLVACSASIAIESDVLISYQCLFMDSDNHSLSYGKRHRDLFEVRSDTYDWAQIESRPIRVCQGAWIGARAVILKGVTIGVGAIVGAASVVTRDVPPWSIVAGNPARVVRQLTPEQIIDACPTSAA